MVRIQRFVLALLLTSSVAFTGCANTRSRFASLWRRGADDSFSESIVDNRKLPRSAREMADSVQDSLRDSAGEVNNTAEQLADAAKSKGSVPEKTRKRYTTSAVDVDTLDNRIDDVVARAKSRQDAVNPKPRTRSDFPEDPFLSEFDALAEASTTADKFNDPVLDRLVSARQKLTDSRNPFSADADVAERLITSVEETSEPSPDVDRQADDAVDDTNPFESLAVAETTRTPLTSEPNRDVETPVENAATAADSWPETKQQSIASTTAVPETDLSDEFPNLDFPSADDSIQVARSSDTQADPRSQPSESSANAEGDEFELMFAAARPVTETTSQPLDESIFRTASAQRTELDSESKLVATPPVALKKTTAVRPNGDDFDRMIVDSDDLPLKMTLPEKSAGKVHRDEFTGARRQLNTYDDFFEADPAVRANQPGDTTHRDTNPFSFAEPGSRPAPVQDAEARHDFSPTGSDPQSVESPESGLNSPFEELDTEDENIPVASTESPSLFDTAAEPATNPMKLAAQPSSGISPVLRVSANSATANRGQELVADGFDLTASDRSDFEMAATISELGVSRPAELPEIVPGETARSSFNNEPFVDLSAVTQTPLENVAWEVEPDASIRPGTGQTSPWIAWIAVALCSIALILLLRPATNRIS